MKAKSIQGRLTSDIKTVLEQSKADGFAPTLAIVLVSMKQDRNEVRKVFDEAGISIFGCTTNGSFIDDNVDRESASILLLDIHREDFTVLFEEYPLKNYREVAVGIAKKALGQFSHPAFLIAGSNIETDAEQLLFGFADIIGNKVNIHGCMAGDDFSFSEQFVFTNDRETNR